MKVPTGFERPLDYSRNATLDLTGNSLGSGGSARDAMEWEERARASQKLRLAITRSQDGGVRDAAGLDPTRKRLLAVIEPPPQLIEEQTKDAPRRESQHIGDDDDESVTEGGGDERSGRNCAELDGRGADPGQPFAALLSTSHGRDRGDLKHAATQAEDEGATKSAESGADQALAATLRVPSHGVTAAPAQTDGSGQGQARIDQIVDHVEAAWRDHLALRPGETIRLQLQLQGDSEAPGGVFDGLSIAVSATLLEVTLLGTGGATPSAALIEAAQALAQQLHQRFPNRIVRIIGSEEEEDASSAGMNEISRLLRGSGDQA